jgi:hypothetical protein
MYKGGPLMTYQAKLVKNYKKQDNDWHGILKSFCYDIENKALLTNQHYTTTTVHIVNQRKLFFEAVENKSEILYLTGFNISNMLQ